MATEAIRPTGIFGRPAKKAIFFSEKAKVFNGDKTKVTRRPMGDTNKYVTKMVTKATHKFGKAKDVRSLYGHSEKSVIKKYKTETFSVPLPEALPVSIQEASADLNKLSSAIVRLLTDVPENVVKVDRAGTSCFNNPQYAQDIINYQMVREKKFALQPDFLDHVGLKPRSRGVLVDWLIQVQDHLSIQAESLHIAVALLDRMLSKRHVALVKLQLYGIVSVFIACKINEHFPPEISELLRLTEYTYDRDELLTAERLVLQSNGFDLNLPTPITFIDRCIQATEGELGDKVEDVKSMALFMLHMGLTDGRFSTILPSLRAAAAYWLARKLLLPSTSVIWTPSLSWYTAYSEHELRPVTAQLARLCIKAPDAKFQGAREKYGSKRRHGRISCHPSLDNIEMLKSVALSTH